MLAFLDKYNKIEVLSCISYMMGMKENSAWKYNLSIIQRYIIKNCNGNTNLNINQLEQEFRTNIPNGITDEEQINLCIDQCITNNRSYSVCALMSEGEQYSIRKMDIIARQFNINDKSMRMGRVMLELADRICEKFGYGRYELGEPNNSYFSFPKCEDLINNPLHFSKYEISKILREYNIDSQSIQDVIYKENKPFANMDIYDEQLSGPLEWYPLYETGSGIMVISPYALLLCAYSFFYRSILNSIGKNSFEVAYNRICLEEIALKIGGCEEHRSTTKCPSIKNLIYKIDIDKYVDFIFVTNFNDDNSLDKILEANKLNEELMHNIIDCIDENEKAIRQNKHIDKIINIIVLCGPKPFSTYDVSLAEKGLVFTNNQLNLIIELLNNELYNLYWFYQDKQNINFNNINNDFEIFGVYYKHGMTFYMNDEIGIPICLIVPGNPLLEDTYNLLWEKDEHVVKINKSYESIKHLDDFADEIPLYVNSFYDNNSPYLYIELESVEVLIFYSFVEEFRFLSVQIAKSIGVWFYVIETKCKAIRLKSSITLFINIIKDGNLKVSFFNKNEFRIDIPISNIDNNTIDEYSIIKALCEAFMKKKLLQKNFTIDQIEKVFKETNGHFLFGENIKSICEIDDGNKSCFTISKRYNDIILQNIAEKFKWTPQKYNIQDSKEIVKNIIEYLNNQLKSHIENLSGKGELVKLLQLHHGLLFWISTTIARYKYYKRIYDYLNIQETKQHTYELSYQETNALCKWLIEQIVLNQSNGNNKRETIDDLYYVFSLIHQLEVFSTFMDILCNTKDNDNGIEILKNGRIAKLSAIDNINKYMQDFAAEQFFEQEKLIDMGIKIPEYTVDVHDGDFETAFKAEYGISYQDYEFIVEKSIGLDCNKDIIDIDEQEFFNRIFVVGIGKEKYKAFKENFMLYKDLSTEIGKGKRFNYSDTYVTRHNRKLELVTRPWIIYDGHVLYSYKSLYRSHITLCNRISNGRLTCVSSEMKKYESTVNDKKGKAFNNAVFNFLSSQLPDSDVRMGVKIGPNEILKNHKNIGDFDLLLKNDNKNMIVGIELKDFIESRTPYEFLSAMRTYKEKLRHVYERCKWIDNEKMQIKKIYPSMNQSYKVKMIFLTHHKSMHKYIGDMEHDVVEMSLIEIMNDPQILFD